MSPGTIGRYQIQQELGRGGMATVYVAYDPNFGRNVAIKLVAAHLHEQPAFRERFEREARAIAAIEHPAIVPVYDFGEQADQLYLVMRYMSGGTLASQLKQGPLSLRAASHLLTQIAPALDAVHAQGIVHRDLKPANILFDGFGNAAISDFGIAFLSTATQDLTGSAVLGTPSYMSPEQVRGEALDGRSDVYALGIILFEMLTGRGPFRAATPLSLALKHVNEPVPSLAALRPDLPEEVSAVIARALAKDRTGRYPSASELAAEVRIIAETVTDDAPAPRSARAANGDDLSTEVDLESEPAIPAATPAPVVPPRLRQASATLLPLAGTAGLLLFFISLCASAALLGVWVWRNSARPEWTATVPASPSLAPSPSPRVLFADDFTDPASGWPTLQNALGGYRYDPDGYHVFVYSPDSAMWALTNRQDADIRLAVDARPALAEARGYYGLLCRVQDDQNFYYFVLRETGDFTLGKYRNAEFQPFVPEGWRASPAIHTDGQPNRLEAECNGSRLRLSVNGVALWEAADTDFVTGRSGLLAASLESPSFEAVFNNFLITDSAP